MPLATAMLYPLINGNRSDFSSATIDIAGDKFNGIKSLNYKQTLEPGLVRGNRAQVLGTTRGKHDAEGNVELYLAEYQALLLKLSALGAGRFGFMEVKFNITAGYAEGPLDLIVNDQLIGCRIKSVDRTNAEGSDALTVKVDLHIMYIIENGLMPISATQFLK